MVFRKQHSLFYVLILVTPPLVEDNTTLRVASWKQFYPLANVAVQKSSIHM